MTENTSELVSTYEPIRAVNLNLLEQTRQAEVALMHYEARFWHMFDKMRNGVAVYEALDGGNDFVFVEFNQAAEQISKKKRADLIGKSVLDLFPPIEEFGLLQLFKRVWSTAQPEHHPAIEFREGTFAGWVEVYAYKLPSGEVVAIFDDVTARKLADQLISQQKELLEHIIENINHPFYIIDTADYQVEMANVAARGQDRPLAPTTCYALSHNRDRPCGGKNHPCPMKKVLRTREPVTMKHTHHGARGNTRPVELHAYPLFDDDGNITSMVEYTLDVVAHKRVKDTVRAATTVAQRERLAQELQDAIAQTIFSAGLIAQLLPELLDRKPAEARHNLAKMQHLIRAATAATRNLLLDT